MYGRQFRRWMVAGIWLGMSHWGLPSVAWAQSQPAAEALFRSGKEAADLGQWQLACERFEESQRLESAPGTLFNLARCREELGQLATSWKLYRQVEELLPRSDARQQYAARKAGELSERVPRLKLIPPDSELELTITLGDVTLGRGALGVDLPLDPGAIRVSVTAAGHEPWVLEVLLEEGVRIEQRLMIGPATSGEAGGGSAFGPPETAPPGSERGDPPAVRHGSSALGWTLLGVGAAGVATGIFGLVWSAVELGQVNAHCDANGLCDEQGMQAGERGRAAVTVSAVGLSVGVLAAVPGALLLARAPRSAVDGGERTGFPSGAVATAAPGSWSMGGGPVPGGFVLTLRGRL